MANLLESVKWQFLTVNKQQAAFVEKTAMRVSLNSKGSEVCCKQTCKQLYIIIVVVVVYRIAGCMYVLSTNGKLLEMT